MKLGPWCFTVVFTDGLWHSNLISSQLITSYIPFLPLEKRHVRKCIKGSLVSMRYFFSVDDIKEELVDEIMKELVFFPEEQQAFSSTGCKRVVEKVHFVMMDKDVNKYSKKRGNSELWVFEQYLRASYLWIFFYPDQGALRFDCVENPAFMSQDSAFRILVTVLKYDSVSEWKYGSGFILSVCRVLFFPSQICEKTNLQDNGWYLFFFFQLLFLWSYTANS